LVHRSKAVRLHIGRARLWSRKRLSDSPAIEDDVRVLECPQCHGTDLFYEAALITGYKYHCKTCNYIGAFVIEREIDVPKR